jgi:hypothetical protein
MVNDDDYYYIAYDDNLENGDNHNDDSDKKG